MRQGTLSGQQIAAKEAGGTPRRRDLLTAQPGARKARRAPALSTPATADNPTAGADNVAAGAHNVTAGADT